LVNVFVVNIDDNELNELNKEKESNVLGMIAGSTGNNVGRQSDANIGKNLCETALKRFIRGKEPKITEQLNQSEFPLGIQWDFYGNIKEF